MTSIITIDDFYLYVYLVNGNNNYNRSVDRIYTRVNAVAAVTRHKFPLIKKKSEKKNINCDRGDNCSTSLAACFRPRDATFLFNYLLLTFFSSRPHFYLYIYCFILKRQSVDQYYQYNNNNIITAVRPILCYKSIASLPTFFFPLETYYCRRPQ